MKCSRAMLAALHLATLGKEGTDRQPAQRCTRANSLGWAFSLDNRLEEPSHFPLTVMIAHLILTVVLISIRSYVPPYFHTSPS
jgi:hypothetical protein